MNDAVTLVTGANGFIGRHLVARLAADGGRVVALIRASSEVPSSWPHSVAVRRVSAWDLATLCALLGDLDVGGVYHLAAAGVHPGDRDVAAALEVNAALPATLVRLAAEHQAWLVGVGSSAEYAAPSAGSALDEGATLESRSLYGASKAAGGMLAAATASALAVPFAWLRLFNVYGPGEAPHRLLPCLVRELRQGRRAALSCGTQIRDFVYVDDVVDAIISAGARLDRAPGQWVWNVCSGHGSSVRDFALSVAARLEQAPALCGFGDLAMRDDDVPWLVGDATRIGKDLQWTAQIGLDAGVDAAVSEILRSSDE